MVSTPSFLMCETHLSNWVSRMSVENDIVNSLLQYLAYGECQLCDLEVIETHEVLQTHLRYQNVVSQQE